MNRFLLLLLIFFLKWWKFIIIIFYWLFNSWHFFRFLFKETNIKGKKKKYFLLCVCVLLIFACIIFSLICCTKRKKSWRNILACFSTAHFWNCAFFFLPNLIECELFLVTNRLMAVYEQNSNFSSRHFSWCRIHVAFLFTGNN